jgi:malic enzyme
MVLEHGLFDICPKIKNINQESLGFIYTPGVAEVCSQIAKNPDMVDTHTTRKRNVIIVTDGSLFGVESSKVRPVLDWFVVQIKYYSGLNAYPLALPSHENLDNTLEDLSNVYGCVLLLETIKPNKIPKDLIVLSHQYTCDFLNTNVFDAEKTSFVLNYLINNQRYGWATEDLIKKGSTHESLTLSIHPFYNNSIHDKDYKKNALNFHEFYRGKINIELNFTDLNIMKKLFTP